MKRCPKCRRDYYDDSLLYCLDDGTALLEGPASGESDTAVISGAGVPSEAATRTFGASTGDPRIRNTSSAEYLIGEINRNTKGLLIVLIALVIGSGGIVYLYRVSRNADKASSSAAVTPTVNIRALIATGNIRNVSISRDGKFLAFVKMENGQESIWTKQRSTNSDIQLVAPVADMIYPLSFDPSGDFVYFGRAKERTVYRIPAVGGAPPMRVLAM